MSSSSASLEAQEQPSDQQPQHDDPPQQQQPATTVDKHAANRAAAKLAGRKRAREEGCDSGRHVMGGGDALTAAAVDNSESGAPGSSYPIFERSVFEQVLHGERRHVLLLGDGDFSFALAFLNRLKRQAKEDSPSIAFSFTATEAGNEADVTKRYFDDDRTKWHQRVAEMCGAFEKVVVSRQSEYTCSVCTAVDAKHLVAPSSMQQQQQQRVERHTMLLSSSSTEENDESPSERKEVVTTETLNGPLFSSLGGERGRNDEGTTPSSSPPLIDAIIFNFPHTKKYGKTTGLVKAMFQQIRLGVDAGLVDRNVIVEMRLRHLPDHFTKLRSEYGHEESAKLAGFELLGCNEADVDLYEGYQHVMTEKGHSAGHMQGSRVWQWKNCQQQLQDQ